MDLKLTITGTDPLLMHNARLANPRDPNAKALKRVTAKRNKSDEDHETIAHLEFMGSLYQDEDAGPYIPGDNIHRCLVDAARKRKLGVKVTSGLMVLTGVNPVIYEGPREAQALWESGRFAHDAIVKVGTSRTTRTRPQFKEWATQAELYLDTTVLDLSELEDVVEIAGRLVGLGDWRPRFGRFEAGLKVVKADT